MLDLKVIFRGGQNESHEAGSLDQREEYIWVLEYWLVNQSTFALTIRLNLKS